MSYSREYLRAPYRRSCLFLDGKYTFKAKVENISEGGMLLQELPTLPGDSPVLFMLSIPMIPNFKDYDLDRLLEAKYDRSQGHVVRVKGEMVRRQGSTSTIDDVFNSRFGVQFAGIDSQARAFISDYVEVVTANLVTLQRYIEMSNSSELIRPKCRALAELMGHSPKLKISELRSIVEKDYQSLQWLD